MSLVVLIPCKHLDRGKSRLASCLSARSREALCTFFLCRTLDVAIAAVGAAATRVITGDPRVAAIAVEYGVDAIADNDADLNDALSEGRARVLAEDPNSGGLILPIDLPLATPGAIAKLIACPEEAVIVPDEAMDGTNALRLAPPAFTSFRFDYGPHSFARHRTQAQASGLAMRSVCDPLLMFDIDGPSQYRHWERDAPAWLHG